MPKNYSTVNIHSFNCRGLQDKNKRALLFNWLQKFQGLIFLQETHCTKNNEFTWKQEWGGKIIFSNGTTNSKGVAILIPNSLDSEIIISTTYTDNSGRIILIDCKIKDNDLILINIYAPTKDKPEEQLDFLNNLKRVIDQYSDKAIILGGDFNTYLDTSIDKMGGRTEQKSLYSENIDNLCEEFSLIDIWRIRHKKQPGFTHRQKLRSGYVQSRLDFWLISRQIEFQIRNVKVSPGFRSDHSIVILEVELLNTQKRGRGFWKFNNDLLMDIEYVTLIKKLINSIKETTVLNNKNILWDYVKCEIRSQTMIYASRRAKKLRKYEFELSEKLKNIEDNLVPGSETFTQYLGLKQEWERTMARNCKASVLRSKAKWVEEGEKNTKYFLNLEK